VKRLRLLARLGALLVTLLLALPFHGAWRLIRAPSPWPRLFLRTVGRIVGARVETRGTPLSHNVIFVSNHVSWTDIPILAGVTGTAFVAKGELASAPLVGWLCALNRTIFVSRSDRLRVGEQVGEVRDALGDGWALTLFPEGTTGDGRELLPFKTALFAAVDPPPPGTRIQPVLIGYGDATDAIAWVDDEPGLDHVRRVLGRAGRFPARLTFLEPFDPAAFSGRKALAAEARARLVKAAALG
jgi:lyso-ornithine lipid O-acyltransferase